MMTNALELARKVLRDAGYAVTSSGENERSLQFEDEGVLGSLHLFESVQDLLDSWEAEQDSFLRKSAKALRAEPAKAWNAYTVALCTQACPDELRRKLEAVEEDFRGTRKIAHANVQSVEDVERALLPLLPLQSVAILGIEDPIRRLRTRLQDSPSRVVEGLVGDTPPQTLAAWLGEGS